jgi:hypothetical protein
MKKSGLRRVQTAFLVEVTRHRRLEMVLEAVAEEGRQMSTPALNVMQSTSVRVKIRGKESVGG